VWSKINCPHSAGFFRTRGEGNPALGFYDDFLFHDTTTGDGYGKLTEHGATVAQIASEATAPGIVRLMADADNEEATLQLGNILDVGAFRLQKDFAFEARIRVNAAAIVATDYGFFVGMATGGASGCCVTEQLFAADAIYGTANLVGFQSLAAESTALDGMYQASGQTKVDGAVDTDLDTVETLVAATWVKVGFNFRAARPRRLEWFVNGIKEGEILETAVTAAAFPDADAAFMQPTIGIRGATSSGAANLDIDWWACAQLY
jgi:hypothetical protein